jgi:hypothetical protein
MAKKPKKPAKRSKKKASKDLATRKDVRGGMMTTRMRTKQPIGIT